MHKIHKFKTSPVYKENFTRLKDAYKYQVENKKILKIRVLGEYKYIVKPGWNSSSAVDPRLNLL